VIPGVLILTGPTASGKSALAMQLAERFDAEIVGADSRQVYLGMEIGTAAPSDADRKRVPHHLVGFLDPCERYSAARFVSDALAAIDTIHARGRRAIVAGGTGFYIRALAGDVALSPAYDADLRDRLAREARVHPPEVLAAWLAVLAPERAATVASPDRYRVGRSLEIALAARRERSAGDDAHHTLPASLRTRGLAYRKVALAIEPRELERRIAARVDAIVAGGLLEEAERVGLGAVAADAVGYREALAYLGGLSTLAELRALLVRSTRRYAKRQATWLRTEPGVHWIGADEALVQALCEVRALPAWG